MASTRGAGHIGPLIPFARAFLRAGDDVLVAAPRSAAATVRRAGLQHRPVADSPDRDLGPIFGRAMQLPPDDANALVISEVFGRIHAASALPGMLDAVRSWAPDVIVRESCEFSSALVADLEGVPHARVSIGLASSEELALSAAAGPLDHLRHRLGLSADPRGERLRREPHLTLTPASFEGPAEPGSLAQRFCDVTSGDQAPLPESWWPGDDRPLVYVSFGSVAGSMGFFPSLYRGAADVLFDLPCRVLMTTGFGGDPADLGTLPPNVHAEQWVPQAQVMAHADAMVGHGGFGSTLAALGAGLPQVIMPLFADQPANGRRVAEVGAGLALEDGPRGLSALPEAVERVLDDPRYRAAAQRIAAEMQSQPSIDDAVGVLEAVAEHRDYTRRLAG